MRKGSAMSDEPTRSEDELERLKQQKERIELTAQIAALTAPWWRKAGLIATMTAIIAAVLPVTTAIQEHYESEREFVLQQTRQQTELALQQARQDNDIRLAYLQRFEVPGHRLQTLRFLLATSTDPRLIAWAQEEQKYVQGQLDKIEEQLLAVTKKLEQTAQGQTLEDLKKERDELNRLKEMASLRPPSSAGSEAGSASREPR